MAITDVLTEIKADLAADAALAALAQPDQPRDANYDLLTLLVYTVGATERLGTADRGDGVPTRMSVHTVRVDLVTPRKDLIFDIPRLMTHVASIPNALFAGYVRDRFNGTIVGIGDLTGRSAGAPGALSSQLIDDIWGEGSLGLRWEFFCTVEEAIVV